MKLHYRYSVKVINPNRKSSFAVQKLQATRKFTSVAEIREELSAFLKSDIKEVGYIEPDHGAKGKLHYLQTTEDLEEMYGCYIGKRVDILLWCYSIIDGNASTTCGERHFSRKRPLQKDGEETPKQASTFTF